MHASRSAKSDPSTLALILLHTIVFETEEKRNNVLFEDTVTYRLQEQAMCVLLTIHYILGLRRKKIKDIRTKS